MYQMHHCHDHTQVMFKFPPRTPDVLEDEPWTSGAENWALQHLPDHLSMIVCDLKRVFYEKLPHKTLGVIGVIS